MDPYVIARINASEAKSQVAPDGGVAPTWGFKCMLSGTVNDNCFFTVSNKAALGADEVIGTAMLSLASLIDGQVADIWLTLKKGNDVTGEIHVRAQLMRSGERPIGKAAELAAAGKAALSAGFGAPVPAPMPAPMPAPVPQYQAPPPQYAPQPAPAPSPYGQMPPAGYPQYPGAAPAPMPGYGAAPMPAYGAAPGPMPGAYPQAYPGAPVMAPAPMMMPVPVPVPVASMMPVPQPMPYGYG
jgi:C2 domain